MGRLFGTSGIRGSAETLFTDQFCFDIGRTFAKFLNRYDQEGAVAVGNDPRESSPRIKEFFIKGLTYERKEVFDEGITPIPAINYILIVDSRISGSAMITGSHTRSDLNGIKFFAFKEEILKKHEEEIERIYEELRNKRKVKDVSLASKTPQESRARMFYSERLKKMAMVPYPSWKIVVDTGNGAQSVVIPNLLSQLGLQVKTLNDDVSQPILTRDPEAQDTGEFQQFQEEVKRNKADFGLVYDSDGDRVTFFNDNGEFIPGDYIGTLLSREINTNFIVTPINTSQVVDYIGKPVIRTRVGSPYVVQTMKEKGATFGFEANGGGIFANIMYSRDGGSSTIQMLNLMVKTKRSLNELIKELPKFFSYRTKVDCPWRFDEKVLKEAKKRFKGIKTEEIDGLKIWMDKTSWILFRSSKNAPEFRVFAEAESQLRATKLGEDGIKLVKGVIEKQK